MTELSPPYSQQAEVSVLGAMLIDPEAVLEVRPMLEPGDFFRSGHQTLYQALVSLHDSGSALDPVTLADHLKGRGELQKAGGLEYMAEVLEAVPTAANVGYHAKIVREKARLRGIIAAAQATITDAMQAETGMATEVFRAAEERMIAATEAKHHDGFRHVQHGVMEANRMIEEAGKAKGGILGFRTGIPKLDRMTAGLQRGDLTILAARPRMGKSALGWQIAEHVAGQAVGVGIASYEMGSGAIARRGLARSSGVEAGKIKRAQLTPEDYKALAAASARIAGLPIWIDEFPPAAIEALRSDVRRMVVKNKIGLVVVDYLQQMSGKGENRNNQVGAVSRGLKRMARELNVHVMALAQLSRGVDHRTPPRPMLADLRDSGEIEQDADNVLMLWRAEEYLTPDDPQEAWAKVQNMGELILPKQRDGETGSIPLHWDGARMTFTELEKRP